MDFPLRIAVDLLSGDTSPAEFISFLQKNFFSTKRSVQLTVFVHKTTKPIHIFGLPRHFKVIFLPVDEFIDMEDDPIQAVRKKHRSPLMISLNSLKEGRLDALLTTGSTGALTVGSKLLLDLLPGITRPALLAQIPTRNKPVAVIDVGASAACKPGQYFEFVKLGESFQKVMGVQNPKSGLLNIGRERFKGREEIRKAHDQLKDLNGFAGNIEGREVFEGKIDILLTDGFTGNVFLKTAEGVSKFILDEIKKINCDLPLIKKEFDYNKFPWSLTLGIDAVVMKCHGYSSCEQILLSLKKIISLLEENFLARFKKTF